MVFVLKKIKNFFSLIKNRGVQKTFLAIINFILIISTKLLRIKFFVKKIYNYRMMLDMDDMGISRTLMLFGERELEHKYILEKVIQPNMRVLDIGANIGYYVLMEAQCLDKDKGEIIAVEPSKRNFEILKKNLELNKIDDFVELHNKGISDINGIKDIYLSEHTNLNTFHNYGTGEKFLSGKKQSVEICTIKKIMNNRSVNLIRMDVEGHEVKILDGLIRDYKKVILLPIIIFETHLSRYNDENNMSRTLTNLFSLGYKIKIAGTSGIRGTKTLQSMGYKAIKEIKSDDEIRVVVENIKNEDAIKLITKTGGLRTVALMKS
jgi:FkbM family methyltransferase